MSDVQQQVAETPASPPPQVEVAPAEGQTATEVAAPETPPKPERVFSQTDLDKILARERAKAERRAEKYGYERARREALEAQLQTSRPQQASTGDEEPTPDKFSTFTEYSKALARWEVRQELKGLGERAQQIREQQTVQQKAAEVRTKLAAAERKYPDFNEVVFNESLPITEHMAEAALELGDVGHDVLYHLGTHPEEADRIAALNKVGQIREIDKIAETFRKAPGTTKAPPPIKPNEGSSGGGEKTLETTQNNYTEWLKVRRRQLQRS